MNTITEIEVPIFETFKEALIFTYCDKVLHKFYRTWGHPNLTSYYITYSIKKKVICNEDIFLFIQYEGEINEENGCIEKVEENFEAGWVALSFELKENSLVETIHLSLKMEGDL